MSELKHAHLAHGRWYTLPLDEQLGNIGSEVYRASKAKGNDQKRFEAAVERALELFDLTLQDPRWNGRHYEIARAREVFADALYDGEQYKSSLQDLTRYFDQFAMAARLKHLDQGRI